jgi:hypothetical protein
MEEEEYYDHYVPVDTEGNYIQLPDRPGTISTLEMPLYLYWTEVHTEFTN